MIVVDTSALIGAFASHPRPAGLAERLGGEDELHAPHLVDVEVTHVLRRLVAAARLRPADAEAARRTLAHLALVRYPHTGLLDRMWQLRANLSAYDAAFVALSEQLGAPLVTADGRLARASGHGAVVELFST